MTPSRMTPLALLAALALVAGAPPAGASIVDPWRTTLSELTAAADVIAHARLLEEDGHTHRLELLAPLWARGEVDPAETALALRCVAGGAGAVGLAFLGRGPDGRLYLLGAERGFVSGDLDAEAFVRDLVERRPAPDELAGRLRFYAEALSRPSGRVREDALRALAAALPEADRVARDVVTAILGAAYEGLGADDPEPAIVALAHLPGGAGERGLLEAARAGVAPALVGKAIGARPELVEALVEELESAGAAAPHADGITRALGYAGDRRATAAVVAQLEREGGRAAALEALAALRDPAAVPTLRPFLERPTLDEDLAWAAVALAYAGGDAALGALEFQRHNHQEPHVRRFLAELMQRPAEVRAAVTAGRLQ